MSSSDITLWKERAKNTAAAIQAIEVDALQTDLEYRQAGLKKIELVDGKATINEAKKRIVDPLNIALKAARAFFKPFETVATERLQAIDRALNDYERREERARLEEQEKLRKIQEKEAARLAKRHETLAKKAEERGDHGVAEELRHAPPPPTIVVAPPPKLEGIGRREVWKWQFENGGLEQNKSKLHKAIDDYNAANPNARVAAAEYWTLDQTVIGQVARATKGKVKIPGVTIFADTIRPTRRS